MSGVLCRCWGFKLQSIYIQNIYISKYNLLWPINTKCMYDFGDDHLALDNWLIGVLFPGEDPFSCSYFYSVACSSFGGADASWTFCCTVCHTNCFLPRLIFFCYLER